MKLIKLQNSFRNSLLSEKNPKKQNKSQQFAYSNLSPTEFKMNRIKTPDIKKTRKTSQMIFEKRQQIKIEEYIDNIHDLQEKFKEKKKMKIF